jgi:hypothetical protein
VTASVTRPVFPAGQEEAAMQAILRTLTRCLVCGSAEVRTDEVIDRGLVFLAECPRCEHRWTSRVPLASERRLRRAGEAGVRPELVSAA